MKYKRRGAVIFKIHSLFFLQNCQHQFHANYEENLAVVHNYPKGDAAPYIARFASDKGEFEDYPIESDKIPPIVTGVWSNQFFQIQGFIKHIHEDLLPKHPDLKLIVYDLGLYQREKEIVSCILSVPTKCKF
jgi:hypothetical protein